MQWKLFGVGCVLLAFVGCGAAPDDSDGNNSVEEVGSAATGCATYAATLQDHVIAGRAQRFDLQFLFWTLTTYATAGENPEQIGSLATQVVTLYPKTNGYTTNALLCQQATCGNGLLEAPTEQCDGGEYFGGFFNPTTTALNCDSFGANPPWASGYNVGCTADCKYDFSVCKPVVCGDGQIGGNEQCDGQNLGSMTCERYTDGGVFTGGQLKCGSNCMFDTSGCTSLCGNGVVDAGEDCDGTLLSAQYAGKTCSDFLVPYRTWPFSLQVPYSPGPITCTKFCKVGICKMPVGCYYVPVAGSQPSSGVRCF